MGRTLFLISLTVLLCLDGSLGQNAGMTSTSTVPPTEDPEMCDCSCVQHAVPSSSTESEGEGGDVDEDEDEADTEADKQEYILNDQKAMAEEMFVETKNLTSTKSKKESTVDDRPSAQAVGYLGLVMMGLFGGLVIAFDFNYIIAIGDKILTYIKARKV